MDPAPRTGSRYWWVNQNLTYAHELRHCCLVAPLLGTNGKRVRNYERMLRVSLGDIVLHSANGAVRAVSTVVTPMVEAPRPYPFPGIAPGTMERVIGVAYQVLEAPIPLTSIPLAWRQAASHPFDARGEQKPIYLSALRAVFVRQLTERFHLPIALP